jgi:hypothetical protein
MQRSRNYTPKASEEFQRVHPSKHKHTDTRLQNTELKRNTKRSVNTNLTSNKWIMQHDQYKNSTLSRFNFSPFLRSPNNCCKRENEQQLPLESTHCVRSSQHKQNTNAQTIQCKGIAFDTSSSSSSSYPSLPSSRTREFSRFLDLVVVFPLYFLRFFNPP